MLTHCGADHPRGTDRALRRMQLGMGSALDDPPVRETRTPLPEAPIPTS